MHSDLVDSWELALSAENRNPRGLKAYSRTVRRFLDSGHDLCRDDVRAWLGEELARGLAPSTVKVRLDAIRGFTRWAEEEGELAPERAAEVLSVRPPKVVAPLVEPYSADELRRILGTCGGDFAGRRDRALLGLLIETGARIGEALALGIRDVDLKARTAVIRRGKGGQGRVVPLSASTARDMDRYLRLRRGHSKAGCDRFWLGARGAQFGYSGAYLTLCRRATAAGLDGFHPHRLRHSAAHRWLAAGGSEDGLRAVAGWSAGSPMLARYTRARANSRALDEFARLDLSIG
jgi:integrase/recombinase XerD